MKNFIVYDPNSGEILRTGSCPDEDFELQGQYVMEGIADDSTQYWSDGNIVNMPPKPENGEWEFDFTTKTWIPNVVGQENAVKSERNFLLQQTDWTQIPNNPLTPEKQEQWAVYRQQLRDVTDQPGYPFNVIWPTPPLE